MELLRSVTRRAISDTRVGEPTSESEQLNRSEFDTLDSRVPLIQLHEEISRS